MALPCEINEAVAANGGGKITIIAGAGCSYEAPTSIPLSRQCSRECHDRLVANGVITNTDCNDPTDLSCLADTVTAKCNGSQSHLVDQLSQHYPLKAATPNDGHLLAAALLSEGAISSVVTINFDLAFTNAIAQLGVNDSVGIIESPGHFGDQKNRNIYYLHSNVNSSEPESWILRTSAIQLGWQNTWQPVITAKVLATPVIIFAGLGTPAKVLIESVKLIRAAISNERTGYNIYQVDPGDSADSPYFSELGLTTANFIKAGWCDFMEALSTRLLTEQLLNIQTATNRMVTREHLAQEDFTSINTRIQALGLLGFGLLRANWLLHDKPFLRDTVEIHELLSDLLLGVSLLARVTNSTAVLFDDGIVEFHRDNRVLSTFIVVSGRGTRTCTAIEGELSTRRRRLRGRATPPSGAIVAGTRGGPIASVNTPVDVVVGSVSEDIVMGNSAMTMLHVDSLRQNQLLCKQLVP